MNWEKKESPLFKSIWIGLIALVFLFIIILELSDNGLGWGWIGVILILGAPAFYILGFLAFLITTIIEKIQN
jgi:hypothetical protein